MKTMEQAEVLATGLRFPEGPVFDAAGRLWCAEQEGTGLFCLHDDGRTERIPTGGHPCGMVVDKQGQVWFCDSGQNAIRRLNPDDKRVETVIDSFNNKPLNRPNDLIFDQAGNLIFTCPGPPAEEVGTNQAQGMVLVLTTNSLVQIVADELSYPNGLAYMPEAETLLIAETQKQRIWSGFWDTTTPSWDTIAVWASTGTVADAAHGPDGMTVGPDGNLYVAIFGEGVISVFDADGLSLRRIPLPGRQPTNCVFDPSGRYLIVTETEHGQLLRIEV